MHRKGIRMLVVRILWGHNGNGKLGNGICYCICSKVGSMLMATAVTGRYMDMDGCLFRLDSPM